MSAKPQQAGPPPLAPITGDEPDLTASLPLDNVVGAVVALAAELVILRDRVATLEHELAARGVVPAGAVEDHRDTPAEAKAREADIAAFANRFWAELGRSRRPLSKIDPSVLKLLKR